MSDEDNSTVKIDDHEFTLFATGDVFCSLTKEELEAEREEARVNYQKYEELLLLEKAQNMSLMDFVDEWKRWERRKEDHKSFIERLKSRHDLWKEDWDDYKYRKDTYDKGEITKLKLEKWRKFHMVMDHIWIGALFIIAYISWNDPVWEIMSYIALIFAGLNIIQVAFRWKTYMKSDEWEVI